MSNDDLDYARYKLAQVLRMVQQGMRSQAVLLRAEAEELERVAQELPRG
jgi:hypothetical protein